MKKTAFFLIITLAAAVSTAAQNSDFSPFVSQIKAEARNNLIRLTWVDSPDARGPVYIFRSARPFSGSIPANIRPVVVRYGVQYYIDDTDNMENIYYFIAASDVAGTRYEVIFPRINSTAVNIVEPLDEPAADASVVITEPVWGISNIRTRQHGDMVFINFDLADLHKNIVLYRSTQPVRHPQDLLNAVIVESGIADQFVDFPVPGSSWYYALIFEDEISGGNIRIYPGINATVSAVTIHSEDTAENFLRPIPLPVLTLGTGSSAGSPGGFFYDALQEIQLSESTADMLNYSTMPSKVPLEFKRPRVFSVDLNAPSAGEGSALFQIIKEYFEKSDWEGACISLRNYLSLPRSKDVEARARFYFGQALYYSENYKDALWEFLSFRSYNPVEAGRWIEAVLSAMVY